MTETSLNITGVGSTITDRGTAAGARGGTEMMFEKLHQYVTDPLLDQFQLICSRVRKVSPDFPTILWNHDTWDDPESRHLSDKKSLSRFARFVFVSHHQFTTFRMAYPLPVDRCRVLRNAIEPIEPHDKPKDGVIRLIYHTTPHRGLELLVPAFEALYKEKFGKSIHLDVYSSFEIYGWKQKDEPYKKLFERIDSHPGMTYHGYRPNDEIREALKKSHVFAYPCIWPETSCIAAMEAMSAGLAIVCPQYEALPETTGGLAVDYPMSLDPNIHVNRFANVLAGVIHNYSDDGMSRRINFQKKYADLNYSWEWRAVEWRQFLHELAESEAKRK